ncbi:hypothetical protein CGCSCA1_v001154 [Colletotrichum siamense]|nr:hypothetical protein CGCSCA1_v001154 [Colletotrichum siamense]
MLLLLGSFQYYLLKSPRTAEQFHRCKLFRNLTPWQTPPPVPFPGPKNLQHPTNHALLRMIHVRIPCHKEHETRRKQVCTGGCCSTQTPNAN